MDWNKEEILAQLEDIQWNSQCFIDKRLPPEYSLVWKRDVECLDIVIDFIKKHYK